MNRTPAEWAAVSPLAVVAGSAAQARNVLAMALADIATLAAENERLTAELEHTRKVASMRLVSVIEGVRADGEIS